MADPYQTYQDLIWGRWNPLDDPNGDSAMPGDDSAKDQGAAGLNPSALPPADASTLDPQTQPGPNFQDQSAAPFDPSSIPPVTVGILGPLPPDSNSPQSQTQPPFGPSQLPPTNVGILGRINLPGIAARDQGAASNAANSPAAAGQYYLPGVGVTYLDPSFADKLGKLILAAQADNIPLRFRYAYRDQAEQDQLKHDLTAITPADKSLHSTGNAVDVHISAMTPAMLSKLVSDAAAAGISWGGNFSTPDRPHFYVDPGGNRSQQIDAFSRAVRALKDQIPDY